MRAAAAAIIIVAAVIATVVRPPRLLLVWNTTASMPIGLYAVSRAAPRRGDLLIVRLPRQMEFLAVSRAILAPATPVLKPVAAISGDVVCRMGALIVINGRFAAIARSLDRHARRLPIWWGCRHLSAFQVFLLARHPGSFDSRYWGPLDMRLALGVAHPLLLFADRLSANRSGISRLDLGGRLTVAVGCEAETTCQVPWQTDYSRCASRSGAPAFSV